MGTTTRTSHMFKFVLRTSGTLRVLSPGHGPRLHLRCTAHCFFFFELQLDSCHVLVWRLTSISRCSSPTSACHFFVDGTRFDDTLNVDAHLPPSGSAPQFRRFLCRPATCHSWTAMTLASCGGAGGWHPSVPLSFANSCASRRSMTHRRLGWPAPAVVWPRRTVISPPGARHSIKRDCRPGSMRS